MYIILWTRYPTLNGKTLMCAIQESANRSSILHVLLRALSFSMTTFNPSHDIRTSIYISFDVMIPLPRAAHSCWTPPPSSHTRVWCDTSSWRHNSNYKAWEDTFSACGIPAANVIAVKTELSPEQGGPTLQHLSDFLFQVLWHPKRGRSYYYGGP